MTRNDISNDAGNRTKLSSRLAALMAVALMSGVVATAHADNDNRKHDQSGWSGGKHFERGGRDGRHVQRDNRGDRRDWSSRGDNRGDRRDWSSRRDNHRGNWNDDSRRGHRVNRDNDRRYRDYYVRDRHGDRDRWSAPRYRGWDYSDYRRYPYYRSHQRYHIGSYYRPAGYYHYAWHRGDRLPRAYYAPRYVVYDYGRYGLYRPPYGHHWVRVDGDVVLAAIATGVVMQVVNQIFW